MKLEFSTLCSQLVRLEDRFYLENGQTVIGQVVIDLETFDNAKR